MFGSIFKKNTANTMNFAHDSLFEQLRKTEFNRLDKHHEVYLDYTGGNLYPETLINQHNDWLKNNTLGNPHSINPTSERSSKFIEEARKSVLEFFNAKDYHCIFTQNASGALKIVGESYPFEKDSFYLLTADNHNSVNGIREYCERKGGHFSYAQMNPENLNIDGETLEKELAKHPNIKNKLFAYPAQSNVTGIKHDLKYIELAKKYGWDVLLDAAAYVPSSQLDLSKYQPDFVSVSFYKIFGYPTGLGCLLVHKNSFEKLHKPWFAGGTVSIVTVKTQAYNLNNNYERFEDGTVNYLNIPAIKFGIDFINTIGINTINQRVVSIRLKLVEALENFTHANGVKMLRILGNCDPKNLGSSLVMLFYTPSNKLVPFQTIELLASKKNISLRAGCFCNPGIDETIHSIETHSLDKIVELSNTTEKLQLQAERGSIRVSIGLATTEKDILHFLNFVESLKDQEI